VGPSPTLLPVAVARRRVLADEVADAIRDAIFGGRIDLGQRLVEEDLAAGLNVSRGTALERLAAESLCRNATPADFKHLAELLGQFDKLPRPLTRSAVASLDVAFHDGVYQAAHNDRLYQAWLALRSQIFLYLVHRGALRADFADSWLKDHEDYLEVLMRRKRVLAVKVVEAHIEGTYQRVLAANRAAGDGSNGRSRSVD
jgi:DNA-binding GntR family transcriptional regulator